MNELERYWSDGGSPKTVLVVSRSVDLEAFVASETDKDPVISKHLLVKKCLLDALKYRDNQEKLPSASAIYSAFKMMADGLGLEIFSQDEDSHSMTICGAVFVIDVDIVEDGSIKNVFLFLKKKFFFL